MGLALFCAVVAIFWPARSVEFLNFDDDVYVSDNPYVLQGLTRAGVAWAFTQTHENYWIPATWLSFMTDMEIHGANPWGFRLTNVLFHAINAVLVFAFLARATQRRRLALFAGFLFALHPLRVESVAWIAERKDVLCTFFALLALLAYVQFARRRSWISYAGVMAGFALSLMAKPAWVTLPLLLMLLDYWPLQRAVGGWRSFATMALEKLPLFALSAGFALLTLRTQSGSLHDLAEFSVWNRIAGVVGAYGFYLWKTVWPHGLAIAYSDVNPNAIAGAGLAILLAGITLVAWRSSGRWAWVRTGWLWFLIALLPVIGLVRVGTVQIADRFTYVPAIGLSLVAAWLMGGVIARWKRFETLGWVCAAAFLVMMGARSRVELAAWDNSFSVFEHALESNPDQPVALNGLGTAYMNIGQNEKAKGYLLRALEIQPTAGPVQINYALVLEQMGRTDEAWTVMEHLAASLPDNYNVMNNLGAFYANRGDYSKAAESFRKALDLNPTLLNVRYNLGLALRKSGRMDEAIQCFAGILDLVPDEARARFLAGRALLDTRRAGQALSLLQEALRRSPHQAEVEQALGEALLAVGRQAEAAEHLERLIAADPESIAALNTLAWVYGTAERGSALHRPERAVELAEKAAARTGHKEPSVLDTLAVSYASAKRMDEARVTSRHALEMAEAGGYSTLAEEIRGRMVSFEHGTM